MGFNEINLNVGCPSKKAQAGGFGACLMLKPLLIFKIVESIHNAVPIPISIKMRLGTQTQNTYKFLHNFINIVSKKNYCIRFIIHARIADLRLSSSRKNRCIPLLNYKYVYRIKKDFPDLKIILNGEIRNLNEAKKHLKVIDGVMLGRSIYRNPLLLRFVDKEIFSKNLIINKKILLDNMEKYVNSIILKGLSPICVLRHMLNIFYGKNESKKLKKYFFCLLQNNTNTKFLFKKLIKKLHF